MVRIGGEIVAERAVELRSMKPGHVGCVPRRLSGEHPMGRRVVCRANCDDAGAVHDNRATFEHSVGE